jgi:hypothetical protein
MDQQDENAAGRLDFTAGEFFGECMMEEFDGVGE